MTYYELLSVLVATCALVISVVSLVRTRVSTKTQLELSRISAQLAERQLDRLVADEPLEGQPIFAIRVTSITGIGDFLNPEYEVQIRIKIDNTGSNYLEPQGVGLLTLQGGVHVLPRNSEVVFKGGLDRLEIEREHTLAVRRGADLLACRLHLRYVDKLGKGRVQEFRVIPDGDSKDTPSGVFFPLERVSTLVPGSIWTLR